MSCPLIITNRGQLPPLPPHFPCTWTAVHVVWKRSRPMVINVFTQFMRDCFFLSYSIMVASPKPGVYIDM